MTQNLDDGSIWDAQHWGINDPEKWRAVKFKGDQTRQRNIAKYRKVAADLGLSPPPGSSQGLLKLLTDKFGEKQALEVFRKNKFKVPRPYGSGPKRRNHKSSLQQVQDRMKQEGKRLAKIVIVNGQPTTVGELEAAQRPQRTPQQIAEDNEPPF